MGDSGYAGLGVAIGMLAMWSVLGIALYVWYLWALARLFPYLGLPKTHGWIPVFNQWRLLERGAFPGWMVLLMFVPGLSIVVVVLLIIAIHRINREHGEGAGMTVLGALIPQIWAMLLANHLRDRGHSPAGSGGTGWQPPAQLVEYGPDGQVYPLLGNGTHAGAAPQAAAGQPLPWAPSYSAEQVPPADAGYPAEPAYSGGPAYPGAPAEPAAPSQDNPWSLGATIDGNFERLASEELPPRDAGFNGSSTAYPFSWPEAQVSPPQNPVTPPPAPPVDVPAPAPEPVPPAVAPPAVAPPLSAPPISQAPAAPSAPPAPPASSAPPAYAAPSAPPAYSAPAEIPEPPVDPEPEIDATIVTGDAVAPIETDDDLDHTVVVARAKPWVLELPDGSVLELPSDDVVIGRRPKAAGDSTTVLIPDSTRTLSKSHARLRRTGNVWTIEDLNSTNGVFVFDEQGQQVEVLPGTEMAASEQLVIGTLDVRLREQA